jgi:hypothetical protein
LSPIAALAIAALPVAIAAQTPKAIGEVTLFGEEQLKVEAATKSQIPLSKAPSAVTVRKSPTQRRRTLRAKSLIHLRKSRR